MLTIKEDALRLDFTLDFDIDREDEPDNFVSQRFQIDTV
jgi:hypothetical protein